MALACTSGELIDAAATVRPALPRPTLRAERQRSSPQLCRFVAPACGELLRRASCSVGCSHRLARPQAKFEAVKLHRLVRAQILIAAAAAAGAAAKQRRACLAGPGTRVRGRPLAALQLCCLQGSYGMAQTTRSAVLLLVFLHSMSTAVMRRCYVGRRAEHQTACSPTPQVRLALMVTYSLIQVWPDPSV